MTDFDRLDPDMWAVYQLAEIYSKQPKNMQEIFWCALQGGVDQGFGEEKKLRERLGEEKINTLADDLADLASRYTNPNPNDWEGTLVFRLYTTLQTQEGLYQYGRLAALVTYLKPALQCLEDQKKMVECTTMLLGCLTKSPRQQTESFLLGFANTLYKETQPSSQPKSFCLVGSLNTQNCNEIPDGLSDKVTRQRRDLLLKFPGWSGPVEYVGTRRTKETSEVFRDKQGKVKVRLITLLTTTYDFQGNKVDSCGKSEILLCAWNRGRRTLPNYASEGGALGFTLRDLEHGITPLVQWERVEGRPIADYSPPVTCEELDPYRKELRQALRALLQKNPLCTVGQVGQVARLDKALAAMYPWPPRFLPDTSRCGKCHKTKSTGGWFQDDPIPTQEERGEWTKALRDSPDRWRWPAAWLPPVARAERKVFEKWCKQRGEFVWRLLSQEARTYGKTSPPPRCL